MVHLFLIDSHMIENREMLEWSSWTHLVGLALSRAGAHGIHPQVRVHLVRTHSRMRINHFGQSHWHRSRAQVQTQDAEVSEQKPNPSGKQHPPHIHTIKKSFRKRKRSRGRKATQSPPKQCVKRGTSKWGPWLKWRTCDPFKRFVEWKRGRFTRDVHQCWEIKGCRFNPITKHFIYLKTKPITTVFYTM